MFKKYRVGDLFDIHPTNTYKMSNADLYLTEGSTPVLSNSSANNGIGGYSGLAPTEKGGIITFSDTTTGGDTMFYQADDFIGYPHVQGMYPFIADKWDEKCSLYAISTIRKAAGDGWSYAVKFNRALVKELMIELPVIENHNPNHEYTVEDIDWQYMKERIKELEKERIKELDAYLKVTGLNDYELNDEDKAVLCTSDEKYIEDFVGDVIWKKVRIGDMFEKCDLKRIKKTFNKSEDISKEKTEEYSIPLVNAKHGNNGIMYYGRKKDWETTTFAIDIVNDGAISTGDVYPQPQETGVLYNAYLIKSKEEITDEKILFFLAPTIEKVIKDKFSYDNKASWEKVKEEEIELPFDSNGNLHKLYIYIYTSYRKNSYQRNDSLERPSIRDIARNCVNYKEFVASSLFTIKKGKRLTKADMITGKINFVGSSSSNNGITTKIGNTEHLHPAHTFTVSYNGSVGEVFLQDERFWASDDVNVWYPNFPYNQKVVEYIMSVVQQLRQKYSYTAKWTLDKMQAEILRLPVKSDGTPDFEYMGKYIKAIEKLVIKDVVVWKDKIIEATRKVVEGD